MRRQGARHGDLPKRMANSKTDKFNQEPEQWVQRARPQEGTDPSTGPLQGPLNRGYSGKPQRGRQ